MNYHYQNLAFLSDCLTAKPMWLVTEKAGRDGQVAKEQDQKKHKSLYKQNQKRNGYVLLPNAINASELSAMLEVFNQNMCKRRDLSYEHSMQLAIDTQFNIQ